MLCQFRVYSKVIQLYIYLYSFFFRFFSHIGYLSSQAFFCIIFTLFPESAALSLPFLSHFFTSLKPLYPYTGTSMKNVLMSPVLGPLNSEFYFFSLFHFFTEGKSCVQYTFIKFSSVLYSDGQLINSLLYSTIFTE